MHVKGVEGLPLSLLNLLSALSNKHFGQSLPFVRLYLPPLLCHCPININIILAIVTLVMHFTVMTACLPYSDNNPYVMLTFCALSLSQLVLILLLSVLKVFLCMVVFSTLLLATTSLFRILKINQILLPRKRKTQRKVVRRSLVTKLTS